MHQEPEVKHQEVYWIPKDRKVSITDQGKRPFRVWTLFLETDPDKKPSLPITPSHRGNAFLEDYVHDWNIERGNVLRYYSRAIQDSVWILVEYT